MDLWLRGAGADINIYGSTTLLKSPVLTSFDTYSESENHLSPIFYTQRLSMPFASENHRKSCTVLFPTNERPPSPLPDAATNQRALSPLSAGDDSGGGFPAGEEPAHASLQGEGPAVLRGT